MSAPAAKRPPRRFGRGMANPAARLSDRDVLAIRARAGRGDDRAALARLFGVARATIDDLAAGRAWRHLADAEAPA